MTITLDDVREQLERQKVEHMERHDEHRRLRDFWHGRHWEMVDGTGARTLETLFRDLGSQSDVGPDAKIVHNIVQQICVKYQTYLSPTPMIRVYTDPPESDQRKAQATLKERALYALWSDVGMSRILSQIAWYLPLMGDCFLGIHPDFDRSVPVPLLRSPEHAYPTPSFDGRTLDSIIFAHKIRESVAKSTFPSYTPASRKAKRGRNRVSTDPLVEVIEYSDRNCWYRWVDGQRINGSEHKYGFNLYQQIPFIYVPDETWNHGAVEQIAGMNLMHDALLSLLFDATLQNVYPTRIIEDAAKLPETLDRGVGAVWPVNAGGKVYDLAPPVQALTAQVGFMENNVRNMEQTAGMPPVNFGQSPASSIVTGKAINELQGAGSGSLVEMVQGSNVGPVLAGWNSSALFMWQTTFRDEKVEIGGMVPTTQFDVRGRMTTVSFKGKQIVGSQNNDVVFSPAMQQHEKLVMVLQARGAGLVSKAYSREQIGIADSNAMEEEMIAETVSDAVIGAALNSLQQDPSADNAQQVEQRAFAQLQGATGPPPAEQQGQPGSPLMLQNMPPPSAPGAAPPGAASPAPAGQPPLPAGVGSAPALPPGPPTGQSQSDRTVTVDQVAQAVSGAQVAGKVFIVGELAVRGQTDGDIELAVTVPDDRDPLAQALGDLRARTTFHVVAKEPSEPHLDVTPGAPAQAGAPDSAGGAAGFPTPPPAPPGQAAQPVLAGATQ